MPYHVIFLLPEPLDAIRAGRKRFEFRLAMRRMPFLCARPGDRALLKRTGGDIEMECVLGRIDQFLHASELPAFQARWQHESSGDYLRSKPGARCGAAIELLDVRERRIPIERTPRGVRAGWVVNWESLD